MNEEKKTVSRPEAGQNSHRELRTTLRSESGSASQREPHDIPPREHNPSHSAYAAPRHDGSRHNAKKQHSGILPALVVALVMIIAAVGYYILRVRPLKMVTVSFVSNGQTAGSCTVLPKTEVAMPEGLELDGYRFIGWKDAAGELVTDAVLVAQENTVYTASYQVAYGEEDEHTPYLFPDDSGLYHPGDTLTRAEAVRIFYVLAGSPDPKELEGENYADVRKKASYASAALYARCKGIVTGENLYPDRTVTLSELARMAEKCFPYADIPAADGDEPVTLYEAAEYMNQVLGRKPDAAYIATLFAPVPDADPAEEGYNDLIEAAVGHTIDADAASEAETWLDVSEKQQFAEGFNEIDEKWYYFLSDGTMAVNQKVGNFLFDENGQVTTGNEELDVLVDQILAQITTDGMTDEEKLRAAFDYTVDNLTYLPGNLYEIGSTGWAAEEALNALQKGKTNCYGFAGVFCVLARALHYDAVEYSGQIPQDSDVAGALTPHGWVEITIDGTDYIFDPELSYVTDRDMYRMTLDSNYVQRWLYDRVGDKAKRAA